MYIQFLDFNVMLFFILKATKMNIEMDLGVFFIFISEKRKRNSLQSLTPKSFQLKSTKKVNMILKNLLDTGL